MCKFCHMVFISDSIFTVYRESQQEYQTDFTLGVFSGHGLYECCPTALLQASSIHIYYHQFNVLNSLVLQVCLPGSGSSPRAKS